MAWTVEQGPADVGSEGRDGVSWGWDLRAGNDSMHRLVAFISASASATDSAHLTQRVIDFRDSKGRSEVDAVLDWEEPPFRLEADTRGIRPIGGRPGPWSGQLLELGEWFKARGAILFFTGHFLGRDPGYMHSHTAHLVDPITDHLINSFKGVSQVEAAENARDWWLRERGDRVSPSTSTAGELGTTEARERQLRSQGFRLLWTKEDDLDSEVFVLQVFDDEGNLLSMGMGDDREDVTGPRSSVHPV